MITRQQVEKWMQKNNYLYGEEAMDAVMLGVSIADELSTSAESAAPVEPDAWISFNVLLQKEYFDRKPITSLQPGVYRHTPLYLNPSIDFKRLRSILACEIECGVFEQHVLPALSAAERILKEVSK